MKLEKIIARETNFSEWYTSVITASNLVNYSSIKGMMIFCPNGWAIWNNIQLILNERFATLNIQNVQLPLFIKYSDFMKEVKHIEGFAPEVFMVTKKGDELLEDPWIVRPTSEVLFCQLFKKTVNSYNDLPLLYNQWCNVFRSEKNTRPFLRTSEFFWHELHTLHANKKEAYDQAYHMIEVYQDFMVNDLSMPVIVGEKTPGERFAGAVNTFTCEALMQDGQVLQSGTSHYLGTNFAKAYDITFQNKENVKELAHQTSTGTSTRLIGAIIMSHSDDKGLVLPFKIAYRQFALLSVLANKEPKVISLIKELEQRLKKQYQVYVDLSDNSMGYKLSEQEVNAACFSLVIGPKDAIKNQVVVINRITNEKTTLNIDQDLEKHLSKMIEQYSSLLYLNAKKRLDSSIVKVHTKEELIKAVNNKKIALAPWGGSEQEEGLLKKETGITSRCIHSVINEQTNCFYTKKPATHWVYFGRAY